MTEELPKSWQPVEISDIAETTSGGTPSRTNPENYCGDIPWIKSGNLNDGTVSEADEHITVQGLKSSAAKVFPPGTILIALYGATIGKLGVLSMEASTNQAICGIFLSEHVSRKYLFHFLYFQRRALIKLGQGGAQPNISQQIVRNIQIPLPPFNEQHRIVAKIDELFSELDDGIASLKTARAQLKIYRQALLKHVFEGKLTESWRKAHADQLESADQLLARIAKEREAHYQKQVMDWKLAVKDWEAHGHKGRSPSKPKPLAEMNGPSEHSYSEMPDCWLCLPLSDLTSLITSGSRGWADYYADAGSTFIRAQNIKHDWLDLSDIAYVELPEGSEGIRTRVQNLDLLITITGANVTKTGIVVSDLADAYVSQHVALVRLINRERALFFHQFIIAESGGRKHLNEAAYGAGKPGLNLENVSTLNVPICSLAEQEMIFEILAARISTVEKLEQDIVANLQQAEALRQSILKKAFSGQLVAQDPTDEPTSVLLERIRAGREAATRVPKAKKKTARSRA